jgi:hypothetical protein
MIEYIFKQSVLFLYWLASIFHTSYETINVIIFVIIIPVIILFLFVWNFYLLQNQKD